LNIFKNAGKGAQLLRHTLQFLGHTQPATTILTDNTTAKGIASGTCKLRRSRSIDQRYHWIREHRDFAEFNIVWHPGTEALADLTTKVQPISAMLKLRHRYVTDSGPLFPMKPNQSSFPCRATSGTTLRGCVNATTLR
jgi:hypothetical protein